MTKSSSRAYSDSARQKTTAPELEKTYEAHIESEWPRKSAGQDSSPIESTPPEEFTALSMEQSDREVSNHEETSGNAEAGKGTRKRMTAAEPKLSKPAAPGKSSATVPQPPPKPIQFSFLTAQGSAIHLRDLQRQEQARNAGPSKRKTAVKKTKKQLASMLPAEYAEYIRTIWTDEALKASPAKDLYLKGKSIFYCDADHNLATVPTRSHLDKVAYLVQPCPSVSAN